MKILMIHDRYLVRGGEDESTDAEVMLLRQHGHEVDFLEVDNRVIAHQSSLRTGLEAVWSPRAYRLVRSRIRAGNPDLVHIQNYFPLLSPAIHHAAKAEHKPVVQALRNYRLFCLNTVFFRDQHICEDCLGRVVPWPGVIHRCYQGSLAGSAAEASMLMVHRFLKTWQRQVDLFLAVSDFVRRKYVQAGFAVERVVVKPNFVIADPGPGEHRGNFALFVGRLSPEKGLATLIAAWRQLPNVPLKIVGEGPMLAELRASNPDGSGIEFLGRMGHSAVLDMMKDASLLVFPSEWYEGQSRVIIEAFACGLPVIAAQLGSAAEVVADGVSGLYFDVGDALNLSGKVKWAWEHPQELRALGRGARREYESRYTAEANCDLLLASYGMAMQLAQGRQHALPAR